MAVLCARPGVRAATNVLSVGIATGTASTGSGGSESTADVFGRRQKVKNARGLRAKGLCGGLLGLPPAHEAPHRRSAPPRGGGGVCRHERDGGGPPGVRPPEDRGLARRSGRERDEPLPGPRPRRDDAPHPDAAPATASNRAPGPRARVRRRLARAQPHDCRIRPQPPDRGDDRTRLRDLCRRVHDRPQADAREQHRHRRVGRLLPPPPGGPGPPRTVPPPPRPPPPPPFSPVPPPPLRALLTA